MLPDIEDLAQDYYGGIRAKVHYIPQKYLDVRNRGKKWIEPRLFMSSIMRVIKAGKLNIKWGDLVTFNGFKLESWGYIWDGADLLRYDRYDKNPEFFIWQFHPTHKFFINSHYWKGVYKHAYVDCYNYDDTHTEYNCKIIDVQKIDSFCDNLCVKVSLTAKLNIVKFIGFNSKARYRQTSLSQFVKYY